MSLFDELNEKGIIAQINCEEQKLKELLDSKTVIYMGIDPTHKSLHVGHLFALMVANRIAKNGNKFIFVLGTGTSRIGDPSGKNEMRKIMNQDTIEENKKSIELQIKHISKNLGVFEENLIFVDNNSWLSKLNYMDFLRDIGINFSVNKMLSFDTFKTRLERKEGLNFIELNYQLLQAYDFLYLFKEKNCLIQMGGDDQWANILAGIELIRKKEQREAYCMTIPLITNSDGSKMGKTEKGAVFLDKELFSSYDFFQFWRNTKDTDVLNYFKFFTFLTNEEIDELAETGDINTLKQDLAFWITSMVHSKKDAEEALQSAKAFFSSGGDLENVPTIELAKSKIKTIDLGELFVKAGLCSSKSECRRLLKQGGIYINRKKVLDEIKIDEKFIEDGKILLRAGKKKYCLVKIV